ncbi:hypothetical protein [Bradyrhizobium lablabi]|uniref:hypothetical protein n=1 Tax=Bradyrhizobium lablabi TaxID=722472 RepID=UPI0012AB7E8C
MSGLVKLKNPPHLESVVEANRDEAEVWDRRRHSVDESKMRLRFGQIRGDGSDLVSSVARQLALSPMVIFARHEHTLDVSVQCLHDTDARHHRRTAARRHQDQSFHRRLPFRGFVLDLRELGNIVAGLFEGDELAAARGSAT